MTLGNGFLCDHIYTPEGKHDVMDYLPELNMTAGGEAKQGRWWMLAGANNCDTSDSTKSFLNLGFSPTK